MPLLAGLDQASLPRPSGLVMGLLLSAHQLLRPLPSVAPLTVFIK